MVRLGIEIGAGLVGALIVGWVTKSLLKRGSLATTLDDHSRSTIARSMFVLALTVAAVLVMSGRNEVVQESLVTGTIAFIPRLIVGVIVIIVAFVLSRLGGILVEQSMRKHSALLASRAKGVVGGAILVIGLLLALKQMGMETDVLLLLLAGIVITAALAGGLGVGLGSQPLAKEIAAGRHVEDRFTVGQMVKLSGVEGRIDSIHLASVRVVAEDGTIFEIPNTTFLDGPVATSPD